MRSSKRLLLQFLCLMLLAGLGYSYQIQSGQKANAKGQIVSRAGDLVTIKDQKSGSMVVVSITDSTKIVRTSKMFMFRHGDQDVTSMVPGLTISAEGVGDAKGQLVASKITFDPNTFNIEVAEQQEIMANQAAAAKAQSTANTGVAKANAAQASANTAQGSADVAQVSADVAQASANKAQSTANAAGAGAVMDAEAISLVNKRVSDLGNYKTVAVAGIYFESGKSVLDAAAKADLDKLAAIATPLEGYMIEVAGYASSTGTKQENQKLSADRAAAVTQYLLQKDNIPMRRILAPAGYGATHPAATNTDPQGRELNRRVDITVLVNQGLNQ